jgi:hypothetical protein
MHDRVKQLRCTTRSSEYAKALHVLEWLLLGRQDRKGGMGGTLGRDRALPSHIMIDAYGAEGEWDCFRNGVLQRP